MRRIHREAVVNEVVDHLDSKEEFEGYVFKVEISELTPADFRKLLDFIVDLKSFEVLQVFSKKVN